MDFVSNLKLELNDLIHKESFGQDWTQCFRVVAAHCNLFTHSPIKPTACSPFRDGKSPLLSFSLINSTCQLLSIMDQFDLHFPDVTRLKCIGAGLKSAGLAALTNHIWSAIAWLVGCSYPTGFVFVVSLFTMLPIILSAILYHNLFKHFGSKGELFFISIVAIVSLGLLYFPLRVELTDEQMAAQGFGLMRLPMHFFSTLICMWGIPKFAYQPVIVVTKMVDGKKVEVRECF